MTADGRPARRTAARRLLRLAFTAIAMALLGGCAPGTGGEGSAEMAQYRDMPDSTLAVVAHERIFFGHQSVGGNIMEGVAELARERPALALRVVAGDSAGDGGPAFAHALVGRNGDPEGKSDDFARRLEGGLGPRVDIAFHKYCFSDFGPGADVPTAFAHYRDTMAKLHAEFPAVRFVHVTTPLVAARTGGVRLLVQRLLGRVPVRVEANLTRERFNDLLRREYTGREPVFDLATIESTHPDGRRERVPFRGQPGYCLVPAWASDGSHLNAAGRRRVAEALLVFLADLPRGGGAPSP